MINDPVGAPADPDLLHLQLLPVVTQGFRAGSSIPEADPVTSLRLMPRNSSGQMEGRIYISGIVGVFNGWGTTHSTNVLCSSPLLPRIPSDFSGS